MVRLFWRVGWPILMCALLLTYTNTSSAAGILKIETKTTVQVKGGILRIRVVFTNKGSAPAYQLQVHVNVSGVEVHAPIVPQLEPGESNAVSFQRDVADLRKGRYPLVVTVDFHDANQYPFSAISGMTFFKETDVNAELIAESEEITVQDEGTLRFNIKNLSEAPREIEANLFVPKEFSASEVKQTISVDARSEKRLNFDIKNFSALPGATYPVFCFFEYDTQSAHHTALTRSVVAIEKDENMFRRFRWLWVTLAAILAVCLIVAVTKERKKQRKA
ncbi:MAG: CARDB domain-containing protein [Deltaproteobacteria bacterium]|nr:CARDB domain-containing protein [Deltaproteobacteria bacterium]